MINQKRIGKIFLLIILVVGFYSICITAQQNTYSIIDYKIEQDKKNIVIGDEFSLKIILTSSSDEIDINEYPDLADNNYLQLIQGYPVKEKTNKFRYTGFYLKKEYILILHYRFKALHAGEINFSGIKINLNQGSLLLKDFSLLISSNLEEDISADNFIVAEIEKSNYFLGEEILITYYLYTSLDVKYVKLINIPFLNDFFYEKINEPLKSSQIYFIDRPLKKYNIGKLRLYPKKIGNYLLPQLDFDVIYLYIDNLSKFEMTKSLKSDSKAIFVEPYTSEAPKDFISLVGDYTISYSYKKVEDFSNLYYTLNIMVQGKGNHSIIDFSKLLSSTNNFEISGPLKKITDNSINITFFIIPKVKGTINLPQISFSYFNVTEKTFKNIVIFGERIINDRGNIQNIPGKDIFTRPDFHPEQNVVYYKIINHPLFVILGFLPFILLILVKKIGNTVVKIKKRDPKLQKGYYELWLNFVENLQFHTVDIIGDEPEIGALLSGYYHQNIVSMLVKVKNILNNSYKGEHNRFTKQEEKILKRFRKWALKQKLQQF